MKKLFIYVLLVSSLFAAPAFNGMQEFKQENSEVFSGRLQGDEYLNWIETSNGSIVMFNNKTKTYDFAVIKDNNLIPSGEKYNKLLKKNLSKEKIREVWTTKRKEATQKRSSSY